MRTARQFQRWAAPWWPLAMTVTLGLLVGPASAANLQVVTSVVNIDVPASAYDPVTATATVTVASGVVAQVNMSKSWRLQMRATSSNFVFTPLSGPGVSKPISDLQLRDTVGGSLFVPTRSFATIDSGANTKNHWVDSTFDLIFLVNAADDPAGQYSVTLEFQVI